MISRWLMAGVTLATVSFAGVAYSNSGGITGKSGKQGSTCTSCHQGGKTPKVTLSGPTSLDAGAAAVYTFQIETDASITGMNAAVSEGALAGEPDGGSTRTDDDEVVHARTVRPDAGVVLYTFTMTAPEYGGTLKLYAAGNAANNDGQTSGDQAAATTLDVVVSGPPRPDAAAPPPATTATSAPPAPPPDAGAAAPAADVDDAAPASQEDSACSIGWVDRSSVPAGAMLGALAIALALLRSRRR